MLRNRLIVLGLFVLSVIAISFYGGPISYGFFFLMLLTPLICAGYAYLVYLRYRIYQEIGTKNVVVGSPTEFYFTLQNEDFFSFSGIKVDFFSDFSYINEMEENFEFELPPHSGLKRETVLVCKYRGEYEVGVRNVIVSDFLRLFNFNFKNRETLRTIVLPKLEILDSMSHMDLISVSKDSKINPTEPDVLIRDYIPGDDLRSINWKASAHLGKPAVRTRTGEETPTIGIIMDSYRYSENPEDYLPLENKILETSLAVTHYYLSKGISVLVHTAEDNVGDCLLQNMSFFEDFYANLSGFKFVSNANASKLFESSKSNSITSCNTVYMILHELTADALALIDTLNRNSTPVVICHITDSSEKNESVELKKNAQYIRIGYEDRLQEVL